MSRTRTQPPLCELFIRKSSANLCAGNARIGAHKSDQSLGCYVASHAHCAHVREKERASKRARERGRERESQLVRVRACVRTQRLTDVLVCTGFLTGFLVRVFILHLAPIHTHEFVRAHMHTCTHTHTQARAPAVGRTQRPYLKPDDKPVSFIRMLGHIWGIIGHMCCT